MMKFRLFKIDVFISYSLVCAAALCVILNIFTDFVCCVFAVIIHELGHLIMMFRLGLPPDKIIISLFEIKIISRSRRQRGDRANLLIIVFGPLANFICFILFFLLYLFCGEFFLPAAAANFFTCAFNLLPVISLDGGQLLYLLLCKKSSQHSALRVVDALTFTFIFPLAVFGLIVLFNSEYNFSLLFVSMYLILSLVLRDEKYF